jgi:flavodoxin
MRTLVIYDSVFGNTEKIAQAIAQAIRSELGPEGEVEILRPGAVKLEHLKGLDLLIIGSPTRGFRPTEDLAGWMKQIPVSGLKGVRVAVFDTCFSVNDLGPGLTRFVVKTGGYAAPRMAKELERNGGKLVVPVEGFIVKDTEGPLKEGELERSVEWGKQLVKLVTGEKK